MKWEPSEGQMESMMFLVSQTHGALWLPMGFGKTSIVLSAFTALKSRGMARRLLVVAPIRALYTVWPVEGQKWSHLRHLKMVNLHKRWGDGAGDADVLLINPERFVKWCKERRVHDRADVLVIDESSLWKAHDSQRFKEMKHTLAAFERRWTLTGTPTPKNYADLWSQTYILDEGRALGRYITHFRNRFCVPNPHNQFEYLIPDQSKREIERLIAPLVFRRELGEGSMPELMHNTVTVDLPSAARDAYDEMERNFFTILESGEPIDSPHAAVAGLRCRQIASGAIYGPDGKTVNHVHTEKIDAVAELVETLADRPLLLFYEFKHEAERVMQKCGGINLSALSGSKAEDAIRLFNEGKVPLLLAHPASAGFALNLQQSCQDVGFITPTWNLSWEQQAIARVWRQGQRNAVTVHRIVAQDTLDERVLEVLASKNSSQQSLMKAIMQSTAAAKV